MPRLTCAPDKFRGTANASEICATVAEVAVELGWQCDSAPMADGGEGTLDVLDGVRRTVRVTGPLGEPVDAQWVKAGDVALIEMAQASGLSLAGGEQANDAVAASTRGTGELIAAALKSGVDTIVVGVGGSATTDGGLGCVEVIRGLPRLGSVDLYVATDVDVTFVEAATRFAAQKGASPSQVSFLQRRLEQLAKQYEAENGRDISQLPGSGAAGGLAGGLAALGAEIVRGFDYLADLVGLDERIARSQLVITGEGHFDDQSFNGKVVGGVIDLATSQGVDVLAIVGGWDESVRHSVPNGVNMVSLIEHYGSERAMNDTLACIAELTRRHLDDLSRE